MLEEKRIDEIYQEMASCVIDLVPDPTSLGPEYFRDKVAECRNMLNRVSQIQSELSRYLLQVSWDLNKEQTSFDIEFDNLMANDPLVRSLGSVDDRKSTANFKLKVRRESVAALKTNKQVLEMVVKVVTARSKELNNTMKALRDQKSAMSVELGTGSFYGDERTTTAVATHKTKETKGLTAEDLNSFFEGVPYLDPQTTETEPTEPKGPAPQEEVSSFLGAPKPEKEVFGGMDLESLLGGL